MRVITMLLVLMMLIIGANFLSARIFTVHTSNIQPVIDAADETGDTIFILPGWYDVTYYGAGLKITGAPGQKSLTLMGAGMDSTFINPGSEGICVELSPNSELKYISIANLTLTARGPGDGIRFHSLEYDHGHLFIRSCRLNAFESGIEASGGYLHLFGSVIDLCARGVYTYNSIRAEIVNNTFAWNFIGIEIDDPLDSPENVVVENNLIINSGYWGINFAHDSIDSIETNLRFNDVWNSAYLNYYNCEPGEGSISLDPLVLNAEAGDYHLMRGSPCIDAGNPAISDPDGSRSDIGAFPYLSETAIDPGKGKKKPATILLEATPNPFNTSTTILYSVPFTSQIVVEIYNIAGQRVKTLVNESQSAGSHRVLWDGTDKSDNNVPSGIYFAVIRAGSFTTSQKIMLVK